jgi:hypothetical protein
MRLKSRDFDPYTPPFCKVVMHSPLQASAVISRSESENLPRTKRRERRISRSAFYDRCHAASEWCLVDSDADLKT